MIKDVIILGSTGSIGKSTLKSLKNNKNYKIKLLSTNRNVSEIYKQAVSYKVRNVILENRHIYEKHKKKFIKKNIKLHLGINNIKKIIKKKVDFSVNAISGINGLEPTLKIIPLTKNILIANKESIICGWDLILKKLKKFKTRFIPIDSEHFSIWSLIKNENLNDIEKIILTASGGPFLNKSLKQLYVIKPKMALRHPNWKMGKKISIDSSTMMNKVFEFIEAKKIFNLKNNHLSILINPKSFVHAIVLFKGGIIKFLAHDTKMTIPISNALNIKKTSKKEFINEKILNRKNLDFIKPDIKRFPVLKIIKHIPDKHTYFETILVTINDELVKKFINGDITYISNNKNLMKLIKKPYFKKYYKLKPKNIYDIKNVIKITKIYLNNNLKNYEY